jgi:hypothetical protein
MLTMKKILIHCGTSAAIVYVGTVILGGLIRPGYSHLSDAISELVADGAPNRSLLSSLFLIYNSLLSVFGGGLFLKAKGGSRGRVGGIVGSVTLVLVGVAGILMELFFPQEPGGSATTFAGTMHFVMAGVASVGTMLAISMLAFWFRNFPELKGNVVYSWISVAIIFLSGWLTAAALANRHPLFGLIERVTIGTFILWLFVISRKLVQLEGEFSHQLHGNIVSFASKGRL